MEPTPVAKSLTNALRLFLIDLEALPEDAFTRSLGGKARTVADIAYETSLVNDHVGMVLRGEKAFAWPDGWIKAPEGWSSKAAVVEGFRASADRIGSTVEAYAPEAMAETIDDQEGGEAVREERVRFTTLHTWYHLGQLNFAQTLLGDETWHWH